MAKASREIAERMHSIDLVIEVRDARIPFSSANTALDGLMAGKHRVIVFNKADLANARLEARLTELYNDLGVDVAFCNSTKGKGIRQLIKRAAAQVDTGYRVAGALMLVAGMPNVGKSSLINAIRRGSHTRKTKTAETGGRPGVTRHVATIQVSAKPPLYLVDSPGIMLPRVRDPEVGLKLALTGAIRDSVVSPTVLADYLLYMLNKPLRDRALKAAAAGARAGGGESRVRSAAAFQETGRRLWLPDAGHKVPGYVKALGLSTDRATDDIGELLSLVAERHGMRTRDDATAAVSARPGGSDRGSAVAGAWDYDKAARYLLTAYREGQLGRLTIDDLDHVPEWAL